MTQLIREGLRAGIWHGQILGSLAEVEVLLHGERVADVRITPEGEDCQRIAVPIPATALEDGIQTFVIRDGTGEVLGHFAIGAGDGMEADLRAEIDVLRAELDLLKRAFRRHCIETSA